MRDFSVAFKRIVISEASTPNSNPTIETWTIDGVPVDNAGVVAVAPGASIEVGIVLNEDSIETYSYVTSVGDVEQRTEEPYARWYTTAGSVDEEVTLYPYLDASVRIPETDTKHQFGSHPETDQIRSSMVSSADRLCRLYVEH